MATQEQLKELNDLLKIQNQDLKNSMEELLDLIEHNTYDMWDTNLKETTTCILLEDKELKDMMYEEDTEDKDFKNHTFTGDKLRKRLNFLRQYINATKTN
tara:strand:+ start:396 stop:695 length:300 start_codon:yes stop_codon:yes gene_type:complete